MRSVADVVGSVESIPGVGNVLFVSQMQHARREKPARCVLHIIAARQQLRLLGCSWRARPAIHTNFGTHPWHPVLPIQVRLLEGEASSMLVSESVRASGDGQQRLQALLPALVDVPLIMNTMRNEIKRAVMLAR